MATRVKDITVANTILRNTPYEAVPRERTLNPATWSNPGFDIVPRTTNQQANPEADAAPAPSAFPAPEPSPSVFGATNYDVAMGKAREKARRALLRDGIANPTERQITEMATQLLHDAGVR